MYVSDCLGVNEKGHLTVSGCDTVDLAKEYGTPVIVYSEDQIRQNCRDFVSSIDENYGGNGMVLYASKAFCCKKMCRICKEEGMGLDVVSGGELYTAIDAGFPTEKIYFHGNNKTVAELVYAVEHGVGRVVVDNIFELERLDKIAHDLGKKVKILLRIKPGIDAHTHDFIRTGQIDSKFGFALETGEAMDAVVKAISFTNIELVGLHCHIGSQIFDIDPFELAAKVMLEFMADIKQDKGIEFKELNLGGGFGIKYLKTDAPRPFTEYMKKVACVVKETCKALNLDMPFVLIEPGRSIVGAAAVTLYTVGAVKKIPDVRTYVSVDGGMTDNPRYILYQSKYEILCANKANEERSETVTVAGKCCESGDLVQEWAPLQKVEPGDILAVLSTGAYNYSMASNYNRVPRPPVVMVKDSKPELAIRGESFSDMVKNDL
ncbi:MAG: diaminopimelate decarboxylase [Clostridia bacterium]|nr:diaminopimelate decarboxylase [Clostridia bacterium]